MQIYQQTVLNTERLVLRELSDKDVFVVHEIRSDKENRQYIDRALDKTIRESADFIKGIIKGVQQKKWVYWGIERTETQELIGTICLWNFTPNLKQKTLFSADIGYELLPKYQGKGFMSEAIQAVSNYGLVNLKLKTIEAHTHSQNEKSIQLLKRNNYQFARIEPVEHSVHKTMFDMAVYQYVK